MVLANSNMVTIQSIEDLMDKLPKVTDDIAKPFYIKGKSNEVGVLLIHGYTGTPAEMRPLGEYLAKKGYTVRCEVLPGHCTTPEDLRKTTWEDWVNAARKWLDEMKKEYKKVFVIGLSLGSLITAYLAEEESGIEGIVILASPVLLSGIKVKLAPVLKKVIKVIKKGKSTDLIDREAVLKVPHYSYHYIESVDQVFKIKDVVKKNLRKIKIPTLIIHGDNDSTAPVKSAEYVYSHISTPAVDKKLVIVHSGHVVTVDVDREKVFKEVYEFIKRYSKPRPEPGKAIIGEPLIKPERKRVAKARQRRKKSEKGDSEKKE